MEFNFKEKYQQEIDEIKKRYPPQAQELIQKAYDYAFTAHQEQKRESGEPYISHCVAVAKIFHELELDYISIAAGLLHDVLEDTHITLEQLKREFAEPIPTLVEGVTKITGLRSSPPNVRYVENLRKMLLAMSRDIRVIIIKLCDRLHNMQTLNALPRDKQLRIARDTLEVYAPLANRLGIHKIKAQLEDLAMLYLYPDKAREIQNLLEQKQAEREEFVRRACEFLRTHLEKAGLKVEVTGRAKHIYSIYRKMQRQDVPLDGIYDLIAIRVITETEEECWTVLGKIHSIWYPIDRTFNDYISMPKDNLYRSIHTTVVGLDGQPIEIQIRTREMHQWAEYGVAAHWRYKEGLSAKPKIEDKLHWIRQLNEWVRELYDPSDFMSALKTEVFADTIFCFTPAGDVIALPKGSTPLDFAYQVHTQIGDRCCGAIVNKRMVPLRYELQNGDIVQILTSKDAHPKHDWLEIVRTPTARAKIRRYLRSQQYQEKVEVGKENLLKALRQHHINLSIEQVLQQLQGEYKKLNVRDAEHLLAEIGFGTLSVQAVLNLLPKPAKVDTLIIPKTKPRKAGKSASGVVLCGVSSTTDINLRLARCCSPIAGEKIIGFITVGRGIAIHRSDCHYLQRVIAENKPDKSRLVEASWYTGNDQPQTVNLRLIAWDRVGLLNEITGIISGMKINISRTKSKSYPGKKQAVIYIAVTVKNQEELNNLLNQLSSVKGLISITRVNRNW